MQVTSYREGNILDTPKLETRIYGSLVQQLLGRYRLVVTIGLPGTGKTTFLDSYKSNDGTHSHWNRQTIFQMLFKQNERDEKYNSYIAEFEANLFPSLLGRESHQLLIDGLNRMPSARQKILKCMPEGLGGAVALCFDGPPQEIVGRMVEEPRYEHLAPFEVQEMVTRMQETIVWPKYSEGFEDIYYVNTFGESGLQMLKELVVKRKT
jgi:hypothetical protein